MSNLILNVANDRQINNLFLVQSGYENCDKNHSFGPFVRDFFLIHFVVEGKGFLKMNDDIFEFKKNDLFLITPGKVSTYWADNDDPCVYYWVGFSGKDAKAIVDGLGFKKNQYIKSVHDFDLTLNAFIKMSKSKLNNKNNTMIGLSGFYEFLHYNLIKLDDEESKNKKQDIITQITNYIEYNYHNEIKIEDLSIIFNISRSQIYRIFMNNFRVSPIEYINNLRLDKAYNLAINTKLFASEIAYAVGYNDPAYFSKLFKQKYKASIKQFRNNK